MFLTELLGVIWVLVDCASSITILMVSEQTSSKRSITPLLYPVISNIILILRNPGTHQIYLNKFFEYMNIILTSF